MNARRLREVMSYSPVTGIFRWKKCPYCPWLVGKPTGTKQAKWIDIKINGKTYKANRLAWLYMTGRWPKGRVDHRDRNPYNNRWVNLRDTNAVVNGQNAFDAMAHSSTGLRGSSALKNGRFLARLKANNEDIYLGLYGSAEEAHIAYLFGKVLYHTEAVCE